MAVTENNYTGNGSTVLYSFTFPYLETTDIKVSLNGNITTAYTLANATTVQFNSAPGNGVAIRIYRDTDDDALNSQFFPGSAIRSQDLNDNFNQAIYLTQEVRSIAVSASTANIANSSITSDKIANGAVTESKLGSAAVSESKIAAGAITESKLGAAAVTSAKIFPGAVSADKAAVASQAQAETGTDATTLMTPQRTKQAIAFNKGMAFQEFTSSGTWTKPTNCTYVMVEVWGAGGGGSSGDRQNASTFRYGGCGGGGGAYNYRLFRASELGATESVTIGTGGTGGVSRTTDGSGTAGTGGGSTSFGTKVSAFGGGAGTNSGTSGNFYSGGGGGITSTVTVQSNVSYGGKPRIFVSTDSIDTSANTFQIYGGGNGSNSITNIFPGRSLFGGSGGGVAITTASAALGNGAQSIYGGCGGGAGGSITNAGVTIDTGTGGSQTTDWGGGGAAGATGGNAGSAGAIFQGGGGGGSGVTVAGGTGGAGGIAGGGGGGGAGTGTFASGAGGAGGAGLCRVWTW